MTDALVPNTAPADESALIQSLRAEIARLEAENTDLQMLCEATIEHGEAVEDQLAESNILLKQIQARLEEEIDDARRYVLSLLPEFRTILPRTDWLLVPSTELGGDAFGYHDIDDNHFAIYLLDVCGHGVCAALLSATILNVIRAGALAGADFRDPSSVLYDLNNSFPMDKQNNMFFTFWYGVYDRAAGILHYANGGHPPAILLRGGGDGPADVIELAADGGLAIGAIPDVQFASHSVAIREGDRVIVVSDGTFELGTPGAERLTFEDLVAFCRKPGGDAPQAVLDWARTASGCQNLEDDFTYLRIAF
jgi:sigma-B regulation protein RsbU (phosphoserine phosphatase)